MRARVGIIQLVVLFAAALSAPLGWAANKSHVAARCAVPKAWHIAAEDAEAVVVAVRGTPQTWRYCVRKAGVFRPLARSVNRPSHTDLTGPPDALNSLILSGTYVAYVANWSDRYGTYVDHVIVRNLSTGRVAVMDTGASLNAGYCVQPPRPLLLAPAGVAAWQVNAGGCGGHPTTSAVQALDDHTGSGTTLDSASPGELASLRLYACSAGCPATTTAVAWTHDGSWRFAQIT
jgi:hypothetical protein